MILPLKSLQANRNRIEIDFELRNTTLHFDRFFSINIHIMSPMDGQCVGCK